MEKEKTETAEETAREKERAIQVTVIIPVKPPEPYLDTLIGEIHQVLHGTSHEILVQDEKGLGYAVGIGVGKSKGDVIVVMDADGSHDPRFLPEMLSMLQEYDVVIGSRYIGAGLTEDSFFRRKISSTYVKLVKWILGFNVSDSMSGYIVAKKSVFDGYEFPYGYKFMLPFYRRNFKYKIAEYPIVFHQRKAGKSKVSYSEGVRVIFQALKLRLLGGRNFEEKSYKT